ncbi:hypothetical protein J2T12_001556 [Paenibacillus anaericanus]|nr:hypothetical protein [Paenibacillus anaericanus]
MLYREPVVLQTGSRRTTLALLSHYAELQVGVIG